MRVPQGAWNRCTDRGGAGIALAAGRLIVRDKGNPGQDDGEAEQDEPVHVKSRHWIRSPLPCCGASLGWQGNCGPESTGWRVKPR